MKDQVKAMTEKKVSASMYVGDLDGKDKISPWQIPRVLASPEALQSEFRCRDMPRVPNI